MKNRAWWVLALSAFLLAATYRGLSANEAQGSSLVLEKLQQISDKQDRILEKLDELRAELDIVKVRATLRS